MKLWSNFVARRNRVALLYLSAAGLNAAVPFLTLPILTTVLTPNDIGVISVYVTLTTVVATFFRFELNTVVKKFFSQSPDLLPRLFGNILSYSAALVTVALLAVSLLFVCQSEFFGAGPVLWIFVVVVAISRLPTLTLHNYWHVARHVTPYVIWSVLAMGGTHLLTLLLAVKILPDWRARVIIELFVAMTSLVATLSIMRRKHGVSVSWDSAIAGRMIKIAAPVWPGALVTTLLFSIDRIVLLNLVSKHDLGIYSVAVQFAALITLVFTALSPPFEAWAYQTFKAGTKNLRGIFLKRFAQIALAGFGITSIVSPVLMWLLPYWVAPEFASASALIPPLMIAFTFFGIFRMMNVCLISLDRLAISSVVNGLTLALNTAALLYFVPILGIQGATYGLGLGFGLANMIQISVILKFLREDVTP